MSTTREPGKHLLRVLTRSVHPELLPDAVCRPVVWPGGSASVAVAAGAHLIVAELGGVYACEMLTPPDFAFSGAAVKRPIAGGGDVTWAIPGLWYSAACSIEKVDAEVFERIDQELLLDVRSSTVAASGRGGSRLDTPPRSVVHAEPVDGGLSVHSVHTFPSDHAVIRVQSLFDAVGPHK